MVDLKVRARFDWSNTPGEADFRPLEDGGLAIQQADGKIFSKGPNGTVRVTDIRAMSEQLASGPLHDALDALGHVIGQPGPAGPVGPQGPIGPAGLRGADGAAGATGARGLTGDAGPRGFQGEQGLTGSQGARGDAGATGPTGPRGLTGDTGSVGPVGPEGPRGATGLTGPQGPQGVIGPSGAKGDTGAAGATGATGPQGIRGLTGDQGAQGIQGPSGPTGPKGETGSAGIIRGRVANYEALPSSGNTTGDIYILNNAGTDPQGQAYAANDAYVYKGGSPAWTYVGPIGTKGEKGDAGATGAAGAQGIKGDTGPQGTAGQKGDTGAIGPQGVQGPQGLKGDTGSTGALGPQGPAGVQGSKGDTGATGGLGPQGPQGVKGDTGATGPQGPAPDTSMFLPRSGGTLTGSLIGPYFAVNTAGDAIVQLETTSAGTNTFRRKQIFSSPNVGSGSDWLFRSTRPSDGAVEDFYLQSGSGGIVYTTGNFNPATLLPRSGGTISGNLEVNGKFNLKSNYDGFLQIETTAVGDDKFRVKQIIASPNVGGGEDWAFRSTRPSDGAIEDFTLRRGTGGVVWTSGNALDLFREALASRPFLQDVGSTPASGWYRDGDATGWRPIFIS